MCPRDEMTRSQLDMPTYRFKDLVDQCKDMGAEVVSCFGFGEPLLDKGIFEKVEYVSDCGLKSFITTNASLLTDRVGKKLMDAGLKHIRFSVHGLGSTYERVFPFRFDRIMRNVDNFLSMRNGVRADVTVIPMHDEPLWKILKFWTGRVDGVEVWKAHNWADAMEYRLGVPKKKTCGRPFNGPLQINADGKMMVCCFDFDAMMTVGDTYKDSVESILLGEGFEEIRHAHRSGGLEGLPCADCDQLYNYAESPLLYSTIDESREFGKTSTIKYKLEED